MDSSQGLLSHGTLMVAVIFPRICSLKRTYWNSNLYISTYSPKEIDSTIHKVTTKLPPKQAILVLKCHTAARPLFAFFLVLEHKPKASCVQIEPSANCSVSQVLIFHIKE